MIKQLDDIGIGPDPKLTIFGVLIYGLLVVILIILLPFQIPFKIVEWIFKKLFWVKKKKK